jgi:hypothetical protein
LGQLGMGDPIARLVPQLVGGIGPVAQIRGQRCDRGASCRRSPAPRRGGR